MLVPLLCSVACHHATPPGPLPAFATPDWPMYGHDPQRSFRNSMSAITASTIANVKPAWTFTPGGSVTAGPVVVGGVVYVGSYDGTFYALDLTTGKPIWTFDVDCQNTVIPIPPRCSPPPGSPTVTGDGGLIVTTAAVDSGRVYFAGGRTIYCLDAATGSLVWKTVICGNPEAAGCETDTNDGSRIFSSPVVYDGLVYMGIDPDGQTMAQVVGHRGAVFTLDADTGAVKWRFETDPVLNAAGNPEFGANGLPVGGRSRGCGGSWASAALDIPDNLVFFGVANCGTNDGQPQSPWDNSEIALDLTTGAFKWSFDPVPGYGDRCDLDMSATANVMTVSGKLRVGVTGKSGTYHLLDTVSGNVVWATNVVYGGKNGGFFGGSSVLDDIIVGATDVGDQSGNLCDPANPLDVPIEEPSIHAFNATTGAVLWSAEKSAAVGATAATPDLVFDPVVYSAVPPGNSQPVPAMTVLRAFVASTGAVAAELPVPPIYSPPAVTANWIVVGTGEPWTGQGNAVVAFQLAE